MEELAKVIGKTKTIIKQTKRGDGCELVVRDIKDPDYPIYYKITITREN